MTAAAYERPPLLADRPTRYCPGCGHGVAHRLLAETLDALGVRDRTIGIAPVGCAVFLYDYIDVDICEAAHGRPPAVATAMKRLRPDHVVFTYQGDGDLASIGLAETMHAANRGENITIIFINNGVYGMTGGQMAPTTLLGQKTLTSPRGRDAATEGHPMRMCEMLAALEAPVYVERCALDTPARVRKAGRAVRRAFELQIAGAGFSFVELLSACPARWRMDPIAARDHVGGPMREAFPLGVFREPSEEPTA